MTLILASLCAFLTGCMAGVFFTSRQLNSRLRKMENALNASSERERILSERAAGAEQALQSERGLTEKIRNEFRLAAQDVLQETRREGAGELESKREMIEQTVRDMKDRLGATEKKISDFQNERKMLEGQFMESIKSVLTAAQSIDKQTAALKQAMVSSSGTRGSYGQHALEQILEQSGLQRGLHYDTQVSIGLEGGSSKRPDVVVRLPGDGKLAIDAKEVAAEFFLSLETDDEQRKREHLEKLAQNIRVQFSDLSKRDYASHLDPRMPIVIMFISNEAAFRAAMSADPMLYEDARQKKIFLTSPQTLVPMIQLIRMAWQQQTFADNAEELGHLVEELGSRLYTFVQHLHGLRKSIADTVHHWDDAVGSWDRKVTPQLERVRELGGKLKDSSSPISIEQTPRAIEKIEPASHANR